MIRIPLLLAALAAAPAAAQTDLSPVEAWVADPTVVLDAADVSLAEFEWLARPVVVFANSPLDPAFEEQMEELLSQQDRLVERDVVIVTDTDPRSGSDLRQMLRPRGFMMVLIGKDGEVELRKPLPWTARELSRSIDKMPLRQRELREPRDRDTIRPVAGAAADAEADG
ncbi:DUF4174 domain-containing protein [Jannaschia sp. Os4]|uniref:DUF4174 domain-containing protein n=1 Tax=Jannaschia sp. Os4 TaxID=2807617 RepID=UPI00193A6CAA|nr:DUF4174 domain-containing protein [Jannaschia sp. Os4]MBM2577287.1 DUF4174 domain-containing protein [Jannaschia sp. Os4]